MRNYKFLKIIIITLTVSIILTSIVLFFVFITIKSKNQNILKLQLELLSHANEDNYLDSMKSMVSNADESINKINSSILNSDGDVLIIETIEKLAQKYGLEINIDSLSLEDLPALKDSGMTTLKIRAKTDGGWIGTYSFISELESLPYKVRIERISSISDLVIDDTSVKNVTNARKWQNVFEIRFLKYK